MAVTPALRAQARSAYRGLWRASSATFSGERNTFRVGIPAHTIEGRDITDATAYEAKVQYSREVAQVLRQNIVQAVRHEDKDQWKIRITKDTELGSNDTVKQPASSSRSARKQEAQRYASAPPPSRVHAAPHDAKPGVPRYYSALKKAHKQRKVPELREEDLEESFVRGDGPGGQSINKTQNNVQLLHKPTGIRVTCQETRSLETNRMFARRLILERLDKIENPGLSKEQLKRAKQIERERRRRKKAKKKDREKQAMHDVVDV
ncbi:hypothetical protein PLICRDRAFT_108835 [Plicaturopsis crispa FD-325 SS-3]|nr:hypothetical protein PLICRDRAFT_108835 [Plicaturopsis crispa FD-325 SS-3]